MLGNGRGLSYSLLSSAAIRALRSLAKSIELRDQALPKPQPAPNDINAYLAEGFLNMTMDARPQKQTPMVALIAIRSTARSQLWESLSSAGTFELDSGISNPKLVAKWRERKLRIWQLLIISRGGTDIYYTVKNCYLLLVIAVNILSLWWLEGFAQTCAVFDFVIYCTATLQSEI